MLDGMGEGGKLGEICYLSRWSSSGEGCCGGGVKSGSGGIVRSSILRCGIISRIGGKMNLICAHKLSDEEKKQG